MIRNRYIENYVTTNKLLNIILLLSIMVIVSFQVTKDWSVLFNLDVEVVNYYYQTLVNLSLGYIVSLMFFILVVYYPEKKKKLIVRAKTSIIFARLQTNLSAYIFGTLEAFDIPFKSTDDIEGLFFKKYQNYDVLKILKAKKNECYIDMGSTVFDVIVNCSKRILNLKQDLVPFLMFMEMKEIEFYADLEEILIFENVQNVGGDLPVEKFFLDDFKYIVDVYTEVQKIVGAHQTPVEYKKENTNFQI